MLRRTAMLATVLVLAMTMGCTTVQRWATGGAVIGAGTGAIWASHAMGALNVGEAAAVGAAGGGLVGALVGDVIDQKRTDKEIRDLNAKISDLENQINQLKAQLAAKDQDLANANRKIAELQAELDNLRKNARIPELQLSLAADVLFRPGSARLSAQGRTALDQAAQMIQGQHKGKFIMVEGHTDTQPIRHSGWKSNWELGSARSLTVLHYLESKGIDPALLSAATFSKYQPVASNDTRQGMAQNRRAVIVVYSAWPRSTAPQGK